MIGARFGETLAIVGDVLAVGSQNAQVGSHDPGAVYLLEKDGSFRAKIPAPFPERETVFGAWIAPVGEDRLAISSDRLANLDGQVYLYDIDGSLLRTFESPSPNGVFGWSVAATNERIAIGAMFANNLEGAVHIYDLENNASPITILGRSGTKQYLGRMVEFLGTDRLLISSYEEDGRGAVFQYDVEGNLLSEIRPSHVNMDANFGFDLDYDNDTIAIGAFGDNESGPPSGAAYLFDLDGNEIVKIFDPHPEFQNWFGRIIVPVGDDGERYLVSSFFDDTLGLNAGLVYLFDRSGAILHTFSSPEPGINHQFGNSIFADGETIYIGEHFNDGGLPDGKGAVWMFVPVDPGDFNKDGLIDTLDLNPLCGEISLGGNEALFDLNDDGVVNGLDASQFLSIVKSLPGDADLSGSVEFSDFLKLSSGFGQAGSWTSGDFDCTGTVDFSDFLILSANFGKAGGTASASVPEPGMSLLSVIVPFLGIRRRRN